MKLLTKPASWQSLPAPLLNNFLWNLDLEYDAYESSKAEAVHSIECGDFYANEKIINSAWSQVTAQTYSEWIADYIALLKAQLEELEKLQ